MNLEQRLREQNRQLSAQVVSLLRSGALRSPGDGLLSPIGHDSDRLAGFVQRLAQRPSDENLAESLCQELRSEFDCDFATLLVRGSAPGSLVAIEQACRNSQDDVPVPYIPGHQGRAACQDFFEETIRLGVVCSASWKHPVMLHPQIGVRCAVARSLQFQEQGDAWVVALLWCDPQPPWSVAEEDLFDAMSFHAGLLLGQEELQVQVRELRDQNDALIRSLPSAVIGLDFLGSVTLWNSKAERLFGLDQGSALGREIGQLVPAFAGIVDGLLPLMQAETCEVELEPVNWVSADGTNRMLLPKVFGLLGANRGEFALQIDDITALWYHKRA